MIFRIRLVLILAIFGVVACTKTDAKDQPESPETTETAKDPRTEKLAGPDAFYHAQFASGGAFKSEDYVGKKLVFGFFSVEHRDSADMLKSLAKLKSFELSHQFKLLAISLDPGRGGDAAAFVKKLGLDLPVLVDSANLDLATQLNVENQVALVGTDNHHLPKFGFKKYVFNQMPGGEDLFISELKEQLGITVQNPNKPFLGVYPQAPDFSFTTLSGKSMRLSQLRGKAVHVIFFSPRCPHCQKEMSFLRDKIYPEYKAKGLEILAFSVLPLEDDVLKLYESFKFTWPVIDDSKRVIRKLFSNEQGVPENYLIDKDGKITFTSQGYAEGKDDLYVMQIKKLLGIDQVPLLSDKKFSGADTCLICHADTHTQWQTTSHAHAFETLIVKGEEHNVECIGCHTLGMDDPKGFSTFKDPKSGKQVANVPPWFQNVQCEHCHGVGGPHTPTSKEIKAPDMKDSCLKCHTAEFSLHFDFDERLKAINHSNTDAILKLTPQQRLELLKKVAKKPEQLFNTKIRYVGSDQCMSCHTAIYHGWEGGPHGKAFEAIRGTPKEKDAAELARRTVGYGEVGGYQESMTKPYEAVGCESCHGPGADHVISKKKVDIRGLGDDCPFCVIEQICLSCHSADPNFNIHKGLEQIKAEHGKK